MKEIMRKRKRRKRHVICMASDFFFPNTGGVEEHIFNLSQCLIKEGHKVIVITHSYGERTGVRYMTGGLKVYYLPVKVMYAQCILPTMICNLALIRYILIRERIEIVHGHSAFSVMGHEVSIIGKLLGLKTVFTDHSLFGFADTSAVLTNKYLQMCLCECDHCICVSHTGKENTVLRAKVKAHKVSVIPNAVDTYNFTPDPSKRDPNMITIVIVSRMVYRKGVDLMAAVIAEMCPRYPKLRFIIGGDGPKMWLLQEVRERKGFQDCVTLLGSLKHSQVRNVLVKGDIFLNTSLTEAYCMAIVEAASCGLKVVSTKVGGIPEVLPNNMIYLTEPNVASLVEGIELAMTDISNGQVICPFECNKMVRNMYNWMDITRRTEIVYDKILQNRNKPLGEQLKSYLSCGVWPFLLVISLMYILLQLIERVHKRKHIDIARDLKL
ncbi:phosphatidylinositol N-acetylglucosaminyltransferase subunit A [Cydia pomonella]|uniref:phosphatidylinositol N-acetylglucosaminyltransferase subunit A n=1 Tax=Cydia pomonella TaxID=82600 RepID=UPI002ADE4653|nr:phosphatidylinositol N-acetylglucosaminyltransferase subunit A [Cydia pomonella]